MINQHETIFGSKFLRKIIDSTPGFTRFLNDNRVTLTQPIKNWLNQLVKGIIKDEESFQDPFTNTIFKEVLGYTRQGDSTPWTCTREYKVFEGKSADIALGFFEKGEKENQTTFVVGEYKSPAYRDLSRKPSAQGMSPVDQAFNYAQRVGISHCHWIIVSNMDEIRLYHSSSMEKYESFRIAELATNAPEFDRFYFLLSRQNLLPEKPSEKSFIDALYDKNQADQADINKKFYAVYSQARQNMFEDLIADNPETDKLHLLEKVQKILDRFLFMCFCEDKGYIGSTGESDPLTKRIFVNAMDSFTGSMWNEFLGIAKAIDQGADKPIHIPPYDGGLFSPDPELEKLNVGNNAFAHLKPLAAYDFESELDVNILGHVFEQSVSDIEELKASINNEDFDKKKGKRKKQGIYYTPAYITGFIIEQTIGAWIEREKEKLGFANLPAISEDEDKLLSSAETDKKAKLEKSLKEKATLHGNAWTSLQENLLNIRVLDPACGSGAFLNKAFWYLVKQHNQIYSQRQHYGATENLKDFDITRVDYHIVRNNLYGVDLSKESVEITKLSLWLQLVYHKEKLPALESSIHYGDSIVSDPNYSKAAFDWQANFPNILNSFASLGKGGGTHVPEGSDSFKENLKERAQQNGFIWDEGFLPYNPKLSENAKQLRKNMTPAERKLWYEFLKDNDLKFLRQHPIDNYIVDFYCSSLRLVIEVDGDSHDELQTVENDKQRDDILTNIYGLSVIRISNTDVMKNFDGVCQMLGERIKNPPNSFASLDKGGARRAEGSENVETQNPPTPLNNGGNKQHLSEGSGFDVVIGNPPYVRQEFLSPVKPALQSIYGSFYNGVADLYTYFYKRGFQLLGPDGYLGFITSSTFTKTGSGSNLREFLKTETTIDRFVDFGDLQLFGEATNYPCILIAKNTKPEDDHKVAFSGIETLPDFETSELLDGASQVENLQANLGTDAWNFDRPEVEALRNKIFSKGKPLKEIVGSPLYGIKTGLNEAFIIDKATKDRLIKEDSKSAELIKPFLVGRDLKQWHYDYQDRFLIFTRHGTDIDQYPAIKKHLEQFKERLEPKPLNLPESESRNCKGRKPGPYKWFEIQDNVAYYKEFDEPKIVWCDISIKPNFSFDTKCNYLGNTGYILSGSFWLNALLMSKCWWYMFTSQSTTVQNGYYRMIFQNVIKPPIVEPQGSEDDPSTDKGKLTKLAKTAQEKAFKRLEYRKGFLGFVADLLNQKSKEAVNDDDVSEGSAINKWDTLSWNEFAKVAASPSAFGKRFAENSRQVQVNMDMKKGFEETKQLCNQLTTEIHDCERQINDIVYRLYDLTPEEIKLLEELTGNIYED